jgi:hypothetical protein
MSRWAPPINCSPLCFNGPPATRPLILTGRQGKTLACSHPFTVLSCRVPLCDGLVVLSHSAVGFLVPTMPPYPHVNFTIKNFSTAP